MKWKILLISGILLIDSFALAQDEHTIASVRIEGNKRIATETYLYYVTVKPGSTYDQQTLIDDFKRLWQTGFLTDLKIETDETQAGIDVIFKVEERPLIKSIEYTGNKKVSTSDIETKLKDEDIHMRVDQPFDPFLAQKVTNAVEKLMLEKGLQFGSAKCNTEALGDSYTKVTFVIDEGPKVRVGDIVFEGNRVFSDRKLKRRMKETREHWIFSWITRHDDFEKEKFQKDMERVHEIYFNNGYINARIDEPKIELYESSGFFGKKKRMRLAIPVQEGHQYRAGEITFSGNTVFKEAELLPMIELKKGKVFNRSLLKQSLEEIQNKYGDRGYIYASLGPVFDMKDKEQVVNVQIEVEENSRFFVNRIEFTGNEFTRDKVIRREMLLQEGDLLRVSKFRESLDRIYRLGFFDDLKPNITPVTGEKNEADITVDLKENKRNEIRLGGGYSEFEGFFGNVVFSTKNLFGSGKIFSINIQGGSRSENYGIEILEPYFMDQRISLGFSLFKTRYDFFNFLRDTTGGSITFGFPVYEELRGAVTYGYQIVDVEQPSGTVTQQVDDLIFPGVDIFQKDRSESRLIPQLVRSTVNNPIDPSRGTRFVFANEIVGGFLGGDLSYMKPSASFTMYLPGLAKKHYLAFNVESGYGAGSSGQELPFFERYFLGGERSIRGYDIRLVAPISEITDELAGQVICLQGGILCSDISGYVGTFFPTSQRKVVVGGNKFFVFNAEYVVNLTGPLKLAAFLDYGNAFAKGKGIDFTNMRGSFGFEVRFLAPFLSAPFRFIYAVNFNRGELMTLREDAQPQRSVFRFSVGTTF